MPHRWPADIDYIVWELDVLDRDCASCGRMMHICDHRYYPGSKEGHIPTRSASEGSGAFPSLARRVNMQQHAEPPCRGNIAVSSPLKALSCRSAESNIQGQALRLMAIRQARLNKLGLNALAKRGRSTTHAPPLRGPGPARPRPRTKAIRRANFRRGHRAPGRGGRRARTVSGCLNSAFLGLF
jgi:hypothetical protein